MLLHQVMSKLMRNYYPPIRCGLNSYRSKSLWAGISFRIHATLVKLEEETEIAENASIGIEGNCATMIIVEDVEGFAGQRVDSSDFDKERCKIIKSCGVLRKEVAG